MRFSLSIILFSSILLPEHKDLFCLFHFLQSPIVSIKLSHFFLYFRIIRITGYTKQFFNNKIIESLIYFSINKCQFVSSEAATIKVIFLFNFPSCFTGFWYVFDSKCSLIQQIRCSLPGLPGWNWSPWRGRGSSWESRRTRCCPRGWSQCTPTRTLSPRCKHQTIKNNHESWHS